MSAKKANIIVGGRVQGVFFRASTVEVAKSLGLTGWVRNNPDGTVEINAEGDEDRLKDLVKWCHKGPKHAKVSDVGVTWAGFEGKYIDFQIK